MPLRDLFGSLIRTAVPSLVGVVLAWLGRRTGIVLSEDTSAQVSMVVTALAGTAYYALARLAEARWKWAGWLLGWNVPPTYTDKAA
jgi:hypothetical protein